MKMAKASQADIKMALELAGMLEGFERGNFPEDSDFQEFDKDDGEHCKHAMELILDKLGKGSLFRVVFGMSVLLDPKNEAIDHSCDHLEHHPKVRMHDELVAFIEKIAAKRRVDNPHEGRTVWDEVADAEALLARIKAEAMS